MSRKFLPKITLSVSDWLRLEQLVSVVAAEDSPAARFLLAEIRRAEIVPDDSDDLKSTVTIGSSIQYRLNWSSLTDARKLVYPEDYASDRSHVSVLSPLGAALIGLRAGSRMPYLSAGWMHVVKVESVSRFAPDVIPLFPLTRAAFVSDESGNDDPGPSAA